MNKDDILKRGWRSYSIERAGLCHDCFSTILLETEKTISIEGEADVIDISDEEVN